MYPNLFEFLRAYKSEARNVHYLWVGQLCIDQLAVDERNHQVQMMGDIYSSAYDVIIWLGSADGQMRSVARFLKMFRNMPGRAIPTRIRGTRMMLDGPKAFNVSVWGDEEWKNYWSPIGLFRRMRSVRIAAINHFAHNAYWTRLWVVQEICLAQRCNIYCGGSWISWTTWTNFIRATGGKWIVDPQIQFLARDTAAEGRFSIVSNGSTLSEAVTNLQDCYCQEPRDKIYAVLGIVKNGDCIGIDYDAPIEEVFQNALRIMNQDYRLESRLQDTFRMTPRSAKRPKGAEIWEGGTIFLKAAVNLGLSMMRQNLTEQQLKQVSARLDDYLDSPDSFKPFSSHDRQRGSYHGFWEPFWVLEDQGKRADWLEQKTLELLDVAQMSHAKATEEHATPERDSASTDPSLG